MINVLYVESGATGGGSFESLYQHLRVIDRERFRPLVVSLNPSYFTRIVEELGIPVYLLTDWLYSRHASPRMKRIVSFVRSKALRVSRWMPWAYVAAARWVHRPVVNALVGIMRDQQIDVVHLNVQIYRDLFGVFAAEKAGVPCISHLRSADPRRRGEFNTHMARYANRRLKRYIANSQMTANYWYEQGIDPGKTMVLYNAVPAEMRTPVNVREDWALDGQVDFVVGCVTPLRGNRLKVDEFLIRGFALFLKRHPNTVLLVVGEGPMKEILSQEARALGISSSVIFTGLQENAKEILAGLDVSLIMQTYDSFGRVVLESMQAGTPVVATDVGGIREIVQHEQNGLLIRYGDEEGFADALERLATDDQLCTTLADNGRRTIEERFSIEHYASSLEDLYMSLVAGRRPSGA